MVVAARPVRQIITVPGMGGQIQVYRPEPGDLITQIHQGPSLEVSKWELDHFVINANITHSGSNGAILRKKVAHDFKFRLHVPWHAMFRALRNDDAFGFLDQLFMGQVSTDWVTCIIFNLGDPAHWYTDRAAFYYASHAKLDRVRTITDSTGTDIIRMEVEGSGSCLLRGYQGDDTQEFGAAAATAGAGDTEPMSAFAGS